MRVLIAGGGTGGHVFPALAVARELESRGAELLFVGTRKGLETRLVPEAGFNLELVEVAGLAGKARKEQLKALAQLPRAIWQARSIIKRFRPSVVLGVGGYASGPVLLAARLGRLPIVLHEQNALMGLTNRVAQHLATRVALSFDPPHGLPTATEVVTGNPVRAEFFSVPPPRCKKPLRLLVFGGSQGARVLNRTMLEALPLLARREEPPRIVHQTGERWHEEVREGYQRAGYPSARVLPFIDAMASRMAESDLVICRAGATTVWELAAAGRGAILVPFAAAAASHQDHNAQSLERSGAAEVLPERELSAPALVKRIERYLQEPALAANMGERARALARPDAAEQVADMLQQLAGPPAR